MDCIFSLDFCVVRVMGMNPPHLFADWADTDICLGGYATNHNFLTINSFKVQQYKNLILKTRNKNLLIFRHICC